MALRHVGGNSITEEKQVASSRTPCGDPGYSEPTAPPSLRVPESHLRVTRRKHSSDPSPPALPSCLPMSENDTHAPRCPGTTQGRHSGCFPAQHAPCWIHHPPHRLDPSMQPWPQVLGHPQPCHQPFNACTAADSLQPSPCKPLSTQQLADDISFHIKV